jgi:hypothetical protein
MRGFKSLIVLSVVLAGLAAYVYFVESKKPEESAATPAGPKVFAAVKAEAVDEITVKSAGGDRTTLKKAGGTWQITAPVTAPADEAEVSGIVTNLATVDIVRTVEENATDLAQFGLAEPRVEVDFKEAGGKATQRLLIGDKTATSGDLYAKLPGDKKVFLIAGSYDTTFNRGTFDLRQKSVLAFERDKVDLVTVQSGTTTIELARAADQWTLSKPVQAPADYGTVEGLIGRVQSAQMKAITAQEAADLKPYGLEKPAASITFGLGSSRATLHIGGKTDAGTVYAKDASRPMVFTVDSTLLDEIRKPADQLRRKDVFEFRAFNATSVQITRGAETVIFEKAKGPGKDAADVWRRAKPTVKDVDAAAFDDFLTKLTNLRAQSFVEAGGKTKTGLETPVLVVTVRFDDGKREEKVTFGRAGAAVHAAMAGQPGSATLNAPEFDDLLKAFEAIK